MPISAQSSFAVVVVGLGPVGATLAGLLGRRGIDVLAVDRSVDVFSLPRAAHIDHTGLRTLQEVGPLDELLPEMIPNPGLSFVTADDRVLASIPGDQGSPSGLPASMYFHQPLFDRTLRNAVSAMPSVDLRIGTEVVAVDMRDHDVVVAAVGPGGEAVEFRASYVVACDGASSPIREWRAIRLEDLGFHERWIVVDLKLRHPVATLPDRAVTYCDPRRPLGTVPMPSPRYRFEIMLMPGEDPVAVQDPAVIEDLVARWVPRGSADVERIAVYAFHGLVAESWRDGRVLLAGDAAHQMPPFLGQGMNSGMRDAANLAWKLERVIRGGAPDQLLDTYESERKPHITEIVSAAVRIGRTVCTLDPAEAARRNRRLLAGAAPGELAFRLPALEPGPLVLQGGGRLFAQPVSDDGTRFDDVVGQRFLVLARDRRALGESATWWAQELGALVAAPEDFPAFAEPLSRSLDASGAAVVVARPDRYVLAVGDGLDGITASVREWLVSDVRV